MVVGITGKYCAGKSTVASAIEQHGFLQIEVDHLGHEALELSREAVAARFGPEVTGPDGRIDRQALGTVVFRDSVALRDLEAIVHPQMVEMVEAIIAQNKEQDIIVNAALLYRMKLERLCDLIVWVDAPLIVRLYRAMKRDRIGLLAVFGRMKNQSDVVRGAAQHSTQDVDIMRVMNACGRRRLAQNVNRLLRRIHPARHE
jgi:dephospho-CoA kinase